MDFKTKNLTKPAEIGSGVVQVIAGGVGLMTPAALANAYAKETEGVAITDDQKKKKLIVNAACLVAGLVGTIVISGNDMATAGVKSFSLGLASGGLKGVASHLLTKEVAKTDAATVEGRLLRGALGCPCDSQPMVTYSTLNRPGRLAQPIFERFERPASLEMVNADPLS